jgi:hypothetical protein
MLRNEKYRGVSVWNRTKKQRNSETGRKVSKARPESEWQRVEVPDWRIVPEELWNAAHAQIKAKARFGAKCLGGMSRLEGCKSYLFSGILVCGTCGSRMVIVAGNGKRGYVKYGCPSHRSRGTCLNNVLIRRDRLEAQLLAALRQRLLNPHIIDRIVTGVEKMLKATRLEDLRDQSAQVNERKRFELGAKAKRIAAAIAEAGHSTVLLCELREIEREIATIDVLSARIAPRSERAMRDLRPLVMDRINNLDELFRADPALAKAKLREFIPKLVLTPLQGPGGPIFDVSGSIDLLGRGCEMQVVARDGVEPPPAFSEPRQSILSIAYKIAGDCRVPASTC